MNKQLVFVKSGLGLFLCFLLVGSGYTLPAHANEAVTNKPAIKKITGTVKDTRGEALLGVNVNCARNHKRNSY